MTAKEKLQSLKFDMEKTLDKHGVEGFNDYPCHAELLYDWMLRLIKIIDDDKILNKE